MSLLLSTNGAKSADGYISTLFKEEAQGKRENISFHVCSNAEDLEQAAMVLEKTYMEYDIFGWVFDGAGSADRDTVQLDNVYYLVRRAIDHAYSTGFVLIARDTETKKVVGACTISHYSSLSSVGFLQSIQKSWTKFSSGVRTRVQLGLPTVATDYGDECLQRYYALDHLNEIRYSDVGEKNHFDISLIGVLQAYRGKKLGESLYQIIFGAADELDVATWTYTTSPAIQKYLQSVGFEVLKTNGKISSTTGNSFEPIISLVRHVETKGDAAAAAAGTITTQEVTVDEISQRIEKVDLEE